MGNDIAVRKGPWKLVKIGDRPAELYNLDEDLGELHEMSKSNTQLSKELWSTYLSWENEVKQSAFKYQN